MKFKIGQWAKVVSVSMNRGMHGKVIVLWHGSEYQYEVRFQHQSERLSLPYKESELEEV